MPDHDLDHHDHPDAVLFENAEWRVLADGLEHCGTGYFIARETIAMRRGAALWEWPVHLAEKSWCAPRAFHEAFLAAVERYGVTGDAFLARSFAVGFGLRAGQGGLPAQDGFVALGDLVRPKSAVRRPVASDPGIAARQGGRMRIPAGARA